MSNGFKSKQKAAEQAFVRQQDQSDCGPACLAAIIQHYNGKDYSIEHLRTLSGTTRQGSTLLGLYQAAQTLNLQPSAYEGTLASLRELDSPSILHVVKQERLLHFVVCYGHADGGFIIGDPASGVSIISEPELDKIWRSKALLIFNPKETFSVDKIRDQTKRTLFWEIIREDRNILVLAFVLGIFVSGLNLSTAIFSQTLIDNILPSKNQTKLIVGLLLLIILLIVRNGLAYIRQLFLARQAKTFNNRVIGRFYSALLRLPHAFFQSRKVGDLVARMNDTQRLQSVVTYVIGDVMIDVLLLVTASGFLLYHNVSVGLIALLSVPFYAALSFYFHHPILIGQREFMSAHALNEGNYVDTIQGIDTIKVNNKEGFFASITKQVYGYFQDKTYALMSVGIRFNLIAQIIGAILIVIILTWCSILVLDGRLTLGVLVAIIQISNLIIPAAWRIGLPNIQLQEARVAFERMYEFTSLKPEYEEKRSSDPKSDQARPDIIRRLDMENLTFRFTGQPLLFENVSLTMNRGEVATLLGDSGCGKTTLLLLLQRFCSPENGQIIINREMDWNSIPTPKWRSRIGVVPQSIKIFNATLAENICLGDLRDGAEKVIQLCRKYGLEEYFLRFPQGYMTLLGEGGVHISGGQQQLVALARALYSQPEILLLDEATSSLDRRSESNILDLLKDLKQEMAVLMVTHRLGIAKRADRIYVLEHGKTRALIKQDWLAEDDKIFSGASIELPLEANKNFLST